MALLCVIAFQLTLTNFVCYRKECGHVYKKEEVEAALTLSLDSKTAPASRSKADLALTSAATTGASKRSRGTFDMDLIDREDDGEDGDDAYFTDEEDKKKGNMEEEDDAHDDDEDHY